ncbi:MAG: polyphosphate polymerase domain-containing protein [Bacteroidetes bacterium]|nr:polyphosphate polymerase domain-containing protein [Bacteroidota bacterium]
MRFEYKYIVKTSVLDPLRKSVLPFVDLDKFAAVDDKHHYTVRSIYFDTPKFNYYYEKVEGIKNRKKLRLRGYSKDDGENIVFFEIKRKYNVPIIKYRAPAKFEDALEMFRSCNINGSVISNKFFPKGNENSLRFCYQMFSKNLRPVVLIVYEREAYHSKFDESVRITFDKNLRSKSYPAICELFEEDKLSPVIPEEFILEIKFNDHFPVWMRPIIGQYSLLRQSASKYVMAMDSSRVVPRLTRSTLYTKSNFRTI